MSYCTIHMVNGDKIAVDGSAEQVGAMLDPSRRTPSGLCPVVDRNGQHAAINAGQVAYVQENAARER